jgi:chromosome segregation ATPase
MMLWKWKKLLTEKDEMIDQYKKKEKEYQSELEQIRRVILQYKEKESQYLRDNEKIKQTITELQQKITEYEQKNEEYRSELQKKEQQIEELQQKVGESEQREAESQRKLHETEAKWNAWMNSRPKVSMAESHFQTMGRIAKKLANEQPSSGSYQTAGMSFQPMTPPRARNLDPNPSSSQMVQFNPFKYTR